MVHLFFEFYITAVRLLTARLKFFAYLPHYKLTARLKFFAYLPHYKFSILLPHNNDQKF